MRTINGRTIERFEAIRAKQGSKESKNVISGQKASQVTEHSIWEGGTDMTGPTKKRRKKQR